MFNSLINLKTSTKYQTGLKILTSVAHDNSIGRCALNKMERKGIFFLVVCVFFLGGGGGGEGKKETNNYTMV